MHRGRSSLRPAAFISFRYSRSSLHHSLRLSASLSRTFRRQSASLTARLWLSRIYHCVSSRSTLADSPGCSSPLRRLRYVDLFATLCSDISFAPHLSRRHCCRSTLSFQNFSLSTLRSGIGYTFSSGRVRFRLPCRTDFACLCLSTLPFLVL